MAFQDIEGHLVYTFICNIIAAVGTVFLCSLQIINLFITPARSVTKQCAWWNLTAGFVAAGICVNCYFLLDTSENFSHALQRAQTRISSSCSEYAIHARCAITFNLTDEDIIKGIQFDSDELSLVKERLTDRVLEISKLTDLNITLHQVISGVIKVIMDLNTEVVRHKKATENFEEAMQNLIGYLEEIKEDPLKKCLEIRSIRNDTEISAAELSDTLVLISKFNKGLNTLQERAVDINNITDIIKSTLADYKEAYTIQTFKKRFEIANQRIIIIPTKDCKEALEKGKSYIKDLEKVADIEHYRWITCLWLTSSIFAFAIILCTSLILKKKICFAKVPKCPVSLLKHISGFVWMIGLFLLTIAVSLSITKMSSLSCISVIKSSFDIIDYDHVQPDFTMTPLESNTTETLLSALIKQAEMLHVMYKLPKLDVVQSVMDLTIKNLSIASSRRNTSKHCLDELSSFVENHPTHNLVPNISHCTDKLNRLLLEDIRDLNLSALIAETSNLAVEIKISNISDVFLTFYKDLQQIVIRPQNVILTEFYKKIQDDLNYANPSSYTCFNNSEILFKEFTKIATTWYIAFVTALVLLMVCTAIQYMWLCFEKNSVAPFADSENIKIGETDKEEPKVKDDAYKKDGEKTTNNGEEVEMKATELEGDKLMKDAGIERDKLMDDAGIKNGEKKVSPKKKAQSDA